MGDLNFRPKNGNVDLIFGKGYNETVETGAVPTVILDNSFVQDDFKEVIMSSEMTLISFVRQWLENYKHNTVKPSTFSRLEQSVDKLEAFKISAMPLKDINLFVLQGYVNELVRTGLSMSTVKKQIEIVTAPLKVAAATHIIQTDPTFGIKMPAKSAIQKKTKKILPYTEKEQARLFAAMASRERSSFPTIELMIETGIRPGEMLALKWDDVDIDRRRVRIHATIRDLHDTADSLYQDSPKSESSNRIVPLTDKAIALLQELWSRSTSEWVNDFRGHRQSYQSLLRHIQYACDKAGVEYRGAHVFRHTFATNCYHKGMDIKILSKILGHAKVDITYNIYIDLYGDGFDEMLKAMTAI